MRFIKIITIAVAVMLCLSATLLVSIWPTDNRLQGTFRSDKEETIKRLISTKSISTDKITVLRQMYGHMSLTFDGVKVKVQRDHHIIQGYPKGSKTKIENETMESYFFIKKEKENKVSLIVLPKPFWRLSDLEIINIQFDSNGFWLASNAILANGMLEKFKRI
jgi:hypothetical protein